MWPFSRSSAQAASAEEKGQHVEPERVPANDLTSAAVKSNSSLSSSIWPFSRSSAQAVTKQPIESSPEYATSAPVASYLSIVPHMASSYLVTSLNSVLRRENCTEVNSMDVKNVENGSQSGRDLDFSLIEVCDWIGPLPRCFRCQGVFFEYILQLKNGQTWHSRCFSTFVCPDSSVEDPPEAATARSMSQDDSAEDPLETNQPPEILSAEKIDFISDLNEPESVVLEEAEGRDETKSEGGSPSFTGKLAQLELGAAIGWAVQTEYVARESRKIRRKNESMPQQEGSPIAESNPMPPSSTGLTSAVSPGHEQEPGDKDSSPSCDMPRHDSLASVLDELAVLGEFHYKLVNSGVYGDGINSVEIERETDEWFAKVGQALDRSVKHFTQEIFVERDQLEGDCDGVLIRATSHSPAVMHAIRLRFGITAEEYTRSFSLGAVEGGDKGEGKSGHQIWSTSDRRFVVKTISKQEMAFLNRILPSYYEHMIVNGAHTLLCRFMGLYTITIDKQHPRCVIVMNNVFYHPSNPLARAAYVVMDEVYDLKGSSINRYSQFMYNI
jgi:hypothetical protein